MKIIILIFIIINLLNAKETDSLLKKENLVYFKYIEDLIKEKKYTKERIKEELNSRERTVVSNLLKALDLDYNKNEYLKAKEYYEEIITKVANKIKNTTEAIYISDYLLREEKYDIINNILTIEYCESVFNKEKEKNCLYYLYKAKKYINISNEREKDILKMKYPQHLEK